LLNALPHILIAQINFALMNKFNLLVEKARSSYATGDPSHDFAHILRVIKWCHRLGKAPSMLESAILQDADKLDALGAIGIMRTVTSGCLMGADYYDQEEPFVLERPYNDKKFTLDHFFVKLFNLPELMNTQSGKEEAIKRREFMQSFLKQLEQEIS
jgi:uncharacterized protein